MSVAWSQPLAVALGPVSGLRAKWNSLTRTRSRSWVRMPEVSTALRARLARELTEPSSKMFMEAESSHSTATWRLCWSLTERT